MKRISLSLIFFSMFNWADAQTYPIQPVPFTSVSIEQSTFWGQRLQASRDVTIPLAFSKCESEGRYKNFEIAARQLKGEDTSKVKVKGYSFDDTDVYKTIEGASYLLQTYPDKKLKAYIDSVLAIVASAQEPDGYLYTARTMNPKHPHEWAGPKRWVKEEDLSHELYNLGHMVEGAIAHYQATGERTFLDIAIRYADCVCREVGPNAGQACVVPGHQIPEMALAKLYTVTGDKKYLDEAKFLLDYRGKTTIVHDYSQAHKPVIEQDEAVGHAVRAAYMYSGMADVAALTGDSAYIRAIDRIWDNIVGKKLYVTGGIGATSSGEAFGRNYELPNMSAYCETCAAIGNVYVNHRLFLLHGESKYYDVLERSLYNGVLSGVSLDGGKFFYPNPLESMGQHQRQAWFGCACCPSNICRFIPSVPGYFYQTKDRDLYVNLFGGNTASLKVMGKDVVLTQKTDYPTDGDIALTIDKNKAGEFRLRIRIPGWVRNQVVPSNLYSYCDAKRLGYSIKVNGQLIMDNVQLENGYFGIDRKWKKGDRIDIHFDMEPRLVQALERVSADQGRVAIERGPLVYCAEWPDNDFELGSILVNQQPAFDMQDSRLKSKDGGEYGIKTLTTDAQILNFDEKGKLTTSDVRLKLIPYYAWNHRGPGRMMVWLPWQLRATRPAVPPTLASQSKIETSSRIPSLQSINDRLIPKDGDDRSIPYTHWWPKQGSTEWITYTFPEASTISQSTVYWFDDQPWQGCKVPDSWRLLYKDEAGQWQEVKNPDQYPTTKGAPCTVQFQPVKTTAVRLEVTINKEKSAGLYEWEVK
ncbi:MAG: glycoside hydrolase family 127 protein [Bacteroidaceae bacterium]|nr:glycoside hydrolase family 127 protein [Bacteroidaceae bacterium]